MGQGRIPVSYAQLFARQSTGERAAASAHRYNVLDVQSSYSTFLAQGGHRYATLLPGLEVVASNGSSAQPSLAFASLDDPRSSAESQESHSVQQRESEGVWDRQSTVAAPKGSFFHLSNT